MYFGKLVFESDEQEFSLRGVKSKKISSHPGRDVLKPLKLLKSDSETGETGISTHADLTSTRRAIFHKRRICSVNFTSAHVYANVYIGVGEPGPAPRARRFVHFYAVRPGS